MMTPDMRERTGMTSIDICPACGYPKFGWPIPANSADHPQAALPDRFLSDTSDDADGAQMTISRRTHKTGRPPVTATRAPEM